MFAAFHPHAFAWKKTACWLLSFLHHLGLFCHILPWIFPHVLNIFPPLAVRTGSSKSNLHFESYLPGGRPATNSNWNSVGTENEEKNTPSFVGDDICLICLICLIIRLLEFQPLESFGFWIYSFSAFFLLSSVKQLALASFPWIGSESFRVRLTHEVNRKFSNLTDGTKFAQDLVTESQNSEVQTDICAKFTVHANLSAFYQIFGLDGAKILTGNWLDVTQIGGFLCGFSPSLGRLLEQ